MFNEPTYAERHVVVVWEDSGWINHLSSYSIIRGCILRDCGNGLFCGSQTTDLVVENNYIYDNDIEGRIYEHNNYTKAYGILFQFNHFGAMRNDYDGNNLKDR